MNEKLSPSELKGEIKEFLNEHKEASLATVMDNVPRSSPVQYFVSPDMELYILSAGGDKFNAIKQNPNVCLLVNTEYLNYRKIKGVQVFGRAKTSVEDPSLLEEAKRYCPEPYLVDHEKSKLKAIKIVPEEIVYLDSLKEGDRTKQILKDTEVFIKRDETNMIQ